MNTLCVSKCTDRRTGKYFRVRQKTLRILSIWQSTRNVGRISQALMIQHVWVITSYPSIRKESYPEDRGSMLL
jgi:hypothetical protein